MHFDDRLATVLRKPAQGETIARIQYRQLLDLLGTRPSGLRGPQIDAAYLRLAELSAALPAPERARILQEQGLRLRSPRLLVQLAEGEPAVAMAALAAAQIGEDQWLDLIPALPVKARGFLRQRSGMGKRVDALLERLGIRDRGLPPATAEALAPTESEITAPAGTEAEILVGEFRDSHSPHLHAEEEMAAEAREKIGAIVRRIEEFRKTRQRKTGTEQQDAHAPRLPLPEMGGDRRSRRMESFDFATDTEGRIVWAETAVAPMAVGLMLAARDSDAPAQATPALIAAFRHRQPIRGALLTVAGAPAIEGQWLADATPRFDRSSGNFTGYSGRMRRAQRPEETETAAVAEATSETDRMRQILHELRTPVNAIQGFSEIIQQQLFGPTPHEYRALAANIAGDSARILAGFDELDRLVKLDSGALELEPGTCDIAEITARTAAQLEAYTAPRNSGFLLKLKNETLPAAMAKNEAERLIWRLLATLAGAAAPGEMLKLSGRIRDDTIRLTLHLPASLAACSDDALLHASVPQQAQALSAGMFGTGFTLRLAATEAKAAGGWLKRKEEKLLLALPCLTELAIGHSHNESTNAVSANRV